MLRILYAANNTYSSRLQLSRFLEAMQPYPYTIKIAAYKQSSSKDVSIDWTLDCLLNMFCPRYFLVEGTNTNFHLYFEAVKNYKPHLIISDMEFFTSHIAALLNIAIWQCSSSMIAMASEQSENLTWQSIYRQFTGKLDTVLTHLQINALENSTRNLVYSHLGDTVSPPQLKPYYEWVRPFHKVGKKSATCQHHLMAVNSGNDKIITVLTKNHHDAVIFSDKSHTTSTGTIIKSLAHEEEYWCNLHNSDLFVCAGQSTFLADAFYNGKYTLSMPNFQDPECVMNSVFSRSQDLCHMTKSPQLEIGELFGKTVQHQYNPHVHFLHEEIERFQQDYGF